MNIIDISWPISEEMTPYKERKLVKITRFRTWEKDKARQSAVELESHAGTHIDAPAHYVEKGKTIDALPLNHFNGSCTVVDLSAVREKITEDDLVKCTIKENDIVLLKTKNSDGEPTAPFNYTFIYLDKSAAAYLATKKVKTVGIDYLGVEREQPRHETHAILLSNNIPIIEGLRLGKVKAGRYRLFCLPLAYKGLEAAPARAVLIAGQL